MTKPRVHFAGNPTYCHNPGKVVTGDWAVVSCQACLAQHARRTGPITGDVDETVLDAIRGMAEGAGYAALARKTGHRYEQVRQAVGRLARAKRVVRQETPAGDSRWTVTA